MRAIRPNMLNLPCPWLLVDDDDLLPKMEPLKGGFRYVPSLLHTVQINKTESSNITCHRLLAIVEYEVRKNMIVSKKGLEFGFQM